MSFGLMQGFSVTRIMITGLLLLANTNIISLACHTLYLIVSQTGYTYNILNISKTMYWRDNTLLAGDCPA